ncbi:hypothetical protein Lesp02_56830 [Lentzea sp. NBRC 105346]|uniref:hypothetical protein n=1 Tax=Lentzea sp. NBRC 105346 TaxID=3032205 RepID=UPI00249FC979|nr:hypothetical protein [Lentzea sp. NBRC 105346]GLZ33495.1 hypothetical protein Lesp02_56830 [Lentzea sp. NBRC 105346]
MSVRTEVPQLRDAVARLHDSWRELNVTVTEDKPTGVGLAVADDVQEAVVDGLSYLDSALRELDGGASPARVYAAAVELEALRRRYDERMRSYLAVSDLLVGIRGHGPEWRGWAGSVISGGERCAEPLQAVSDALMRCWREITDEGGGTR